ncbi:Oidioi.mRNA.OKI2018_I69.PAR.g9729.t1.cds [Oikopleura dioica]|uniref:chitinase n=1 Tax=Oikopleura dioica TaxID=34765 RepID=A0ABN7RSF9_OIKDI|nr:Oidioi.mRNA.OKI2018_I69.PAR.g9729.t1.cds [Oikopleura dioica]
MKLSVGLLAAAAAESTSNDQGSRTGYANSGNIVCYYTNWSQYRPGSGKFLPEDIDPNLCTHLVFSFAKMCNSAAGWTLCPYEWNDMDETWADGLYTRMRNLKNQNSSLKVLLAVGGWNHGSTGFVEMASSTANIDAFITNSMAFVNNIGYDGLDLDWEYPAKTTVDSSPPADYQNFQTLCERYRARINANQPGFILTAAVGIGQDKIFTIDGAVPSYNVSHLSNNLDMIHLMAYDIHGHWEDATGHHAMAYTKESDDRLGYTDSIDWIIYNWIDQGADPKKLVLGLGAYGRTFKLAGSETGFLAPASLGSNGYYSGAAGTYTREPGYLAYYEICEKLRAGWTSVYDDEAQAPYAYGDGDWVGYDNQQSIGVKVNMAKSYGLAGIMWWAIDVDDFDGSFCNQGRYPLMNYAKQVLLSDDPVPTNPPTTPHSTQSTQSSSTQSTQQSSTTSGSSSGTCDSSGYAPHPSDCSKYIQCTNTGNIEGQCGNGLYWDQSATACNWDYLVDCPHD